MILKLVSVSLYIVGGFFVYMVSLLAFINVQSPGAKSLMVLIFTIPAVIALVAGIAVERFQNWRRRVGIVLLSATGFTIFLIFTLACLLMSEEFKRMMTPDTVMLFSDYVTGSVVIVLLAAGGTLLLRASNRGVEQAHAPDALPRAGDAQR